jgi:hypothetical protein
MASTLAGNLTLVGSVANLIVAHRMRGHRLLNLFQSRRAAHAADASLRRLVAKQQRKAADSEVIGKVADRYDARHRAV